MSRIEDAARAYVARVDGAGCCNARPEYRALQDAVRESMRDEYISEHSLDDTELNDPEPDPVAESLADQVRKLAEELDEHGGWAEGRCAERLRALLEKTEPDPVAQALAALGEAAVEHQAALSAWAKQMTRLSLYRVEASCQRITHAVLAYVAARKGER